MDTNLAGLLISTWICLLVWNIPTKEKKKKEDEVSNY
jgi:hypothetical protein